MKTQHVLSFVHLTCVLRVTRSMTLLAAFCWLMRLPCPCTAQMQTLGGIEFYGLQHVSEASVRQAFALAEGDPLPATPAAAEAIKSRLRALPGVQNASISSVCCVAGKTVIFIGIEEKGSHSLHFRAAPQAKVRLASEFVEAGEAFDKALMDAVQHGDTGEDDSQGYTLTHAPAVRAVQQRFLFLARRDPRRLQQVLLHSADGDHRALAAEILGYAATNDQKVIDALVLAMSDPDASVRNNAMRALAVRAIYAQNTPNVRLRIPFVPFIRLLNSLDWTDRNKSLFALLELSQKRDHALLKSLREEALPTLIEMAHWKRSGYGQPAFILLGRIGGLSDGATATAWQQSDYAQVLAAVQEN